ncbi:hypothetical protein INT47_009534 [Mucor saturninus]|uniref:Transcription factor Opi1 n=1 Tax=Mucor saturninus TaxID=64648 RepID=A0A8H7V8N6_9FUNG|nr:hypothetical protein INT47_009534 [Mucor saturninus]
MTLNHSSPMSITQLINNEKEEIITPNDIQDPDVKIAAEVLGDMARLSSVNVNKPMITLPPLSTPSTTPSSPLPTPTSSSFAHDRLSFSSESTMDEDQIMHHQQRSSHFIHRVSNIPLVNSALRAYESSKNSNSVVKYGAEMVESIAAPIYGKFGKHALSGVDEWGCKQLDRLEERYPDYVAPKDEDDDDDDASSTTLRLSRVLLDDHENMLYKRKDSRDETSLLKNRSRNCSRSTSPHRPYAITKPIPTRHHRQQTMGRSKWHQIVMHASSAAGTTAAVISEESMKCLRYCLSWLQYASQHIDQQMNLLRKFLVSLASNHHESEEGATTMTTHDDASTLAQIKKEIVDTLRKVVEVISKYAGSGLPEQAKAAVRGFILALPTRWAMLNSPAAAPAASPSVAPADSHIHDTSIKLLNFGGESIEMIQSVALVFSDTIERAELWLNRLRVVGVTRTVKKPEQMDLN